MEQECPQNDLTNRLLSFFERVKKDPNRLSFWFPKIKDCGIPVPETIILPINFEQFQWLISDNYRKEDIAVFSKQLQEQIKATGFSTNRPLFLKTGVFSNKFQFNTSCKLDRIENIGKQYLDIYYAAMLVGCELSAEVVLREFLPPEKGTETIYSGMPLRTEFRAFYDFDRRSCLDVFNYWDTETMEAHLRGNDVESFAKAKLRLESEFARYRQQVAEKVETCMKNVDLTGTWSVDLMKVSERFYLTDMARAENSYYYERIKTN